MFKLDLEKAEEPEIKLPKYVGSLKKLPREFQKNVYFCFIDYATAFVCVDHNKLENSERDRNSRPPGLPLEKPIKQRLELDNNKLVLKRKRSTSRLYTVTLLI